MVTQLPEIKQDSLGAYVYFGGALNANQVEMALTKLADQENPPFMDSMRMNKTTRDALYTLSYDRFTTVDKQGADTYEVFKLEDGTELVIEIDAAMRDLYVRFQ